MRIVFDESGDLGFDFSKKATTSYFDITALFFPDNQLKKFEKSAARTIKNKIHVSKKKLKKPVTELKGSGTSLAVKKYLWKYLAEIDFTIHSVVLNKKKVTPDIQWQADRIYNYLARQVIDDIPLNGLKDHLYIQIDRSKGKHGREELNKELIDLIQGKIPPTHPLTIEHALSQQSKTVQITDMIAWGILRKYTVGDTSWYDLFKDKIAGGGEKLIILPTHWN